MYNQISEDNFNQLIKRMIVDYPNDFILFAENSFGERRLSTSFTHLESAKIVYNKWLSDLDINWKISIRQLNRDSFKEVL